MSQEQLLTTLMGFGLTRIDSQVYLFLAKREPQKGNALIGGLNVPGGQVYRSLKSLQSKGIITVTMEHPARFSAVPFEAVVEMFIKAKMDEAQQIQQSKDEILAKWQSIAITESPDISAKFNILEGRSSIYSKFLQMIQVATTQISVSATVSELARTDQFGIFEAASTNAPQRKIQLRILTQLSKRDANTIKKLLSEMHNAKLPFEGRALESAAKSFPQMLIRDQEEALFFISPREGAPSEKHDQVCLWTNSKSLVDAFQGIFESLWHNSASIEEKIDAVETGKTKPKPLVSNLKAIAETMDLLSSKNLPATSTAAVLAEPILVGRDRELEELERFLDSSVRGHGNTVFISGEAGSGKTRISKEFLNRAQQRGDINVISGQCLSSATNPYFPFVEAFNYYFASRVSVDTTDEKILQKDANQVAEGTMENEEVEIKNWLSGPKQEIGLGRMHSITPQAWRDQAFYAIAKGLIKISAEKPTILFLEDLHWADSASLSLFHHLARAIASERILLLATFRSDELFGDNEGHEHPLVEALRSMRREDLYKEIKLPCLMQADVTKIAENMLGGALHQAFAEELAQKSGGNALFIVESLRMLHEKGELLRVFDQWRSVKENFGVPIKVQDIILQRLNRLTWNQRRLLDVGSVVGEEFDVELLGAVLGKDTLKVLETLNTISRSTSLVCTVENRYRFDHARCRETLYKEIPLPLRSGYHAKVAEVLENKSDVKKLHLGALSYHFAQAGNTEKAVKFALAAGQDALARWSNKEAITNFTYVVENIGEDSRLSAEKESALEGLGDAYFAYSLYKEAIKASMKLADTTQNVVVKLRALRKAMYSAFERGDTSTLVKLIKKAEPYAATDRLENARVLMFKGRSFTSQNLFLQSLEYLDAARRVFEEEYSLRDIADANIGGLQRWAQTGLHHVEGLVDILRALALFEELEDFTMQMTASFLAGLAFANLTLYPEALGMYTKLIELDQRTKLGSFQQLSYAYSFGSAVFERIGDPERALSYSLKALETSNKTDSLVTKGLALSKLVIQYSQLEDMKHAEKYLEKIMKLPPEILSHRFQDLELTKAVFFSGKQQWKESNQYFKECFEKYPVHAKPPLRLRIYHAWALERQGRREEAEAELQEIKKECREAEERFEHSNLQAHVIIRRQVVLGKDFEIHLDVVNVGRKPGLVVKLEVVVPSAFEIQSMPSWCSFQNGSIDMKMRKIEPFRAETIKLTLRAMETGTFGLKPHGVYIDDLGEKRPLDLNPITITVNPSLN